MIKLLVLICAAACSGCTYFSQTRSVEILIPPETYWEDSGHESPWYLVTWPGRNGEISTLHVPAGVRSVFIEIDKGADIPILARPFGARGGFGGWAGTCSRGEQVELHQRLGALISLMIELWEVIPRRCSELSMHFWSKKLLEEVAPDNEWDIQLHGIDEQQARISIMTGDFTRESLRILPSAVITVPGLEAGRWTLEDDPAQWFYLHEPIQTEMMLPFPGSYSFINREHDARLAVMMDGNGVPSWEQEYLKEGRNN